MDINGAKPSAPSSRPDTPPGNKETKGDGVSDSQAAEAVSSAAKGIGKESKTAGESIGSVIGADEAVYAGADRVESLAAVRALEGRDEAAPEVVYADAHKLLAHAGEGRKDGVISLREWEVNFALLHSAYRKTDNPELKQKIRFLMNNYLQKTAYFNTHMKYIESQRLGKKYTEIAQYGQMTFGGMYHRTSDSQTHHLERMGYDHKFGARERADYYIPMDTMEIDHLYQLNFRPVMDAGDTRSAVGVYVDQFGKERGVFPNNMKVPILIDVSKELGESLLTDGDPSRIRQYKHKLNATRKSILENIKWAVKAIKKEYPDIEMSDDELHAYLLMNTAVVARGPVHNGLSVMSLCNKIFEDDDFKVSSLPLKDGRTQAVKKYQRKKHLIMTKLYPWVNHTGIALGAVKFREELARSHDDPSEIARLGGRNVTWAKEGTYQSMMYASPKDILRTSGLKRLKEMGGLERLYGKGQAILARGTAQMIETLFAKIPESKWAEVQEDPVAREVIQNAMVRLMHHIGDANISTKDFRKYTQAIDRIHAELTTILLFFEPFEEGVFEQEYGKYIEDLFPGEVKPAVIGIGKAAMSIYCGVNAAIMEDNPEPVRVFGEHTYYEQTGVMGTASLESVLTDPSIEKVDVFTCEFYHNINPDVQEMRYQRENLVHDIKEIFHRKPDTDSLTVVIDSTLDFTKSEDLKELFEAFEEEIKEGRINFVMIRSGQKYDMLGLDNYFGAPFYIVNNGDAKWAKINAVKEKPAHQTDNLSNQYFRWMAASDPKIMDDYKKQIYRNTRDILEVVPIGLKPKHGREVVISDMDEGVSTPFFEIAFKMKDKAKDYELMMWMHNSFTQIFVSHGKLAYARGSFGFAHPNFMMIEEKIRINPGLDPDDLGLYEEFFEALDAKVKELNGKP